MTAREYGRAGLAALALVVAAGPALAGDVVQQLQERYRNAGAGPFSAAAGEELWRSGHVDPETGQRRSCTTCHTSDLTRAGEHARTGKRIEPMAPSVNPKRLTEVREVRKWFLRNCKWTLGRECTAQEKGDLLAFLKGQ